MSIGHKIVAAGIILVTVSAGMQACSGPVEAATTTTTHLTEVLDRYGPDEYGVVCYRYIGPVSCVKVK